MLSAEQLEQRKHGIGASEIAAVAGLNPYATAWDVWLAKTTDAEDAPTEAMELGNLLEEPVAQLYARRNPGVELRPSGTLSHPEHPWAMATPDRLVLEGGRVVRLLEVKTAGLSTLRDWGSESDGIPEQYIAQVQWQLFVAGYDQVDVAALVAGAPRYYRVERNEVLIRFLFERGQAFTGLVRSGGMPPIDASATCARKLAELFPRNDRLVRPATDEEQTLMGELAQARATAGAAGETAKRISNELVALAAGAKLTFPGDPKKAPYGQPQACGGGARVDVALLREKYPEAAQACTTQTEASITFRTYRLEKE